MRNSSRGSGKLAVKKGGVISKTGNMSLKLILPVTKA